MTKAQKRERERDSERARETERWTDIKAGMRNTEKEP